MAGVKPSIPAFKLTFAGSAQIESGPLGYYPPTQPDALSQWPSQAVQERNCPNWLKIWMAGSFGQCYVMAARVMHREE
jgi:hypothetical protein